MRGSDVVVHFKSNVIDFSHVSHTIVENVPMSAAAAALKLSNNKHFIAFCRYRERKKKINYIDFTKVKNRVKLHIFHGIRFIVFL